MQRKILAAASAAALLVLGSLSSAAEQSLPALPASTIATTLWGGGGAVEGGVLYSNTTETGSRFTPGGAGATTPADPARVAYDDVPIPVARLGGNTAIDITKITVGIRRVASVAAPAPATDVDIFLTGLSTTAVAPDTQLNLPATLLGTVSLPSVTASVTTLVSVGDGVTPIATNFPLNTTLFAGFGTMSVGVRLSDTTGPNGWRLTSGPDGNSNVFWLHDPNLSGQANPEGAFLFSNATPPAPLAAFYISVEGVGVPEPTSLSLLGLGAAGLLRRRR